MSQRLAIVAVAAIVILGGLFFALRPAQEKAGPQQRTFDLAIKNGVMTPAEITVSQGDKVTIRITTDKPAQFHLHGYDLAREITQDKPVTLNFDAMLGGQFEIEDESSSTSLGKLIVVPPAGS